MNRAPRVVAGDLAEAEAVLAAAAELGVPVILMSPPAAAATHGAAYFRELWAAAAEARPAADFEGILDCGGAAGYAMAALAEGITRLRLDAPGDVLDRVRDMAAKSGARLDESNDAALEFSTSTDAALRDWLRGGLAAC